MKKLSKIYICLLLSFCGHSAEDYGPDDTGPKIPNPIPNKAPIPPPTQLNCPGGTYLTYNNFGQAFLQQYCLTCHSSAVNNSKRGGSPSYANFDSHDDVQRYRALMLTKTQGNNAPMPPSQDLPKEQQAAFAEWLNCGAPKANNNPL